MQKFSWDENLNVGIQIIDEEHKTLIQKINELSSAIDKGIGETEITKTIGFLKNYSLEHFANEEKIMQEKNYPQINEHKQMHKLFISTINDIEQDYREEGANKALVNTINNLLLNWLKNHIREVDIRLADFIKNDKKNQ
ncbi:MAG TPA: bacteriohemerythrin [Victivallales bacterium]|nr:bacteriohemerythrin [Victivallales bacterium]HPO89741.1 bacteriohemerythrin [Victivallales bacterium]HRU01581.1 bacteriohemerythrin [Victivallales bacterium]